MDQTIPEFCDYVCPHAEFPPAQTEGLCRTMSAVWCRKLKALVNKNGPCEWRRRAGQPPKRRRVKVEGRGRR